MQTTIYNLQILIQTNYRRSRQRTVFRIRDAVRRPTQRRPVTFPHCSCGILPWPTNTTWSACWGVYPEYKPLSYLVWWASAELCRWNRPRPPLRPRFYLAFFLYFCTVFFVPFLVILFLGLPILFQGTHVSVRADLLLLCGISGLGDFNHSLVALMLCMVLFVRHWS